MSLCYGIFSIPCEQIDHFCNKQRTLIVLNSAQGIEIMVQYTLQAARNNENDDSDSV